MSKINLRNYDELIVTEKEAARVLSDKEKIKDEFHLSLPYNITHEDGVWIGTLKEVTSISSSEKRKPTHYLKREDVERFHNTHGYGRYKSEYIKGYGVLDVQTQYLIGTKQAKLEEDTYGRTVLKLLKQNDATIKWAELWQDYLTKLDPFNELRQPDNSINN